MGGYRPVKTKCWIAFLKFKNCKHIRTTASHDQWQCPGCFRNVVVREKDKEIPSFHINTNLDTMKIDKKEFWSWVETNC
ncbi:hypothetical protein ABIB40_003416 [Pedobacter sp. UYP30]